MSGSRGQSILEYALIGCLVAVMALTGLTLFGKSLKETFMAMVPSASAIQPGSGTGTSFGGGSGSTIPGSGGSSSGSGASGSTVSVPSINLQSSVQTTGVNGATSTLSDQLTSIAQQLQQAGNLTPEQANLFSQLANQGHRMAAIEKVVEQAASIAQSPSNFNNMQVTFEGKTYTVNQLFNSVGWLTNLTVQLDGSDLSTLSPDTQSPELKTFFSLYQQLKQSNALQDPQVQSQVSQLVSEIAYLSEVSESSGNRLYSGDWTQSMTQLEVSGVTNVKSSNICQVGQGTDTGQQCN